MISEGSKFKNKSIAARLNWQQKLIASIDEEF